MGSVLYSFELTMSLWLLSALKDNNLLNLDAMIVMHDLILNADRCYIRDHHSRTTTRLTNGNTG